MKRKFETTEVITIVFTIIWLLKALISRHLDLLDKIGLPIMIIATIMVLIKWIRG